MRFGVFLATGLVGLTLLLTACGEGIESKAEFPNHNSGTANPYDKRKSVFGDGGLGNLFGGDDSKRSDGAVLGVNAYLWRASLDTVNFMPIANADPFGGTILTDWYSSPQAPNERFKLNIFILDSELRADGVRVSVFRQTKDKKGTWSDAPSDRQTATDLENAILTKARALRVAENAK